ncbi:F-box/kelch-repeat protein At3g06240-like [Lycium ferocissimum]|uniref:F-box/kelch-repeat protein At3g06240-like n=1 Tax=Lycium ferocissimum TaxID=112874 RepID=UPI002816545F|nr:F-box/kelch-repeat protein At3g06240-like [Lycium ferocissimum]
MAYTSKLLPDTLENLSSDLVSVSQGKTYTIILWNPAIRRSITLPKPTHVQFGSYGPHICLGFGFDQKTHDHKVVRIAYLHDDHEANTVLPSKVEVYSLSTGLWKTVNSKIHCKIIEYVYTSVYLSGAIHWISYTENEGGEFTNSLLVFDLSKEKFSEIGLPQELVHVSPFDLSVRLCGGQISMIWFKKGCDCGESWDRCAVWVMNQYGELESWTKKFVVVLEGGISHVIGFTGNGESLVMDYNGDLLSYNPESMEWKDLDIHGAFFSFFLSKYAESLVLLDGSSGATVDPSDAEVVC